MKNHQLSNKIIELRLLTRKACMCEQSEDTLDKKNTLTLKSKMLYLLTHQNRNPSELMQLLLVGKTNLTILAKGLIQEGLIEKIRSESDRRQIEYAILPKGQENIKSKQEIIERYFKNILTNQQQYTEALDMIDKVIELLSYL